MHEYALMKSVIKTVVDDLGKRPEGGKVRELSLRVGALEVHSEESFRQGFAALSKDTPLEGASLKLDIVAAQVKCPGCGFEGAKPRHDVGEDDPHDHEPWGECPKCGALCPLVGGRGVEAIEVEVDTPERKP